MKNFRFLSVILLLLVVTALVLPATAADAPSISASDQVSLDRSITVASAYSAGPGFVVVRNDGGRGTNPGPVLGFRWVNAGWNYNVKVQIDAADMGLATSKLFVTLHKDAGEAGTFEFANAAGNSDAPVAVDDKPVQQLISVQMIDAADQFVADDTVVIANVVTDAPGWLVVHSGDAKKFGGVLGQTQLKAGRNRNVRITLATEGRTDILWAMIHVDNGEAGKYEFTGGEIDAPVVVGGVVASTPIWSVPHMRVADQIVVPGDATLAASTREADAKLNLVAASVLSQGPGFIVIHKDDNGKPGGVAGFAAVEDGGNADVTVELDPKEVTPVLWPMLHVDTGEAGKYEFGAVQGADGPVSVGGKVVVFAINAAPAMRFSAQELKDGAITIDSALIEAPGWVAVHSNKDGAPGPVIATYPLLRGLNSKIVIKVAADQAGTSVFPMLHYDTGEAGKYEFGEVKDADAPVFVSEKVVVSEMKLDAESAKMAAVAALDCSVTPRGDAVNLRASASTTAAVAGQLRSGETAKVVGSVTANNNKWWQLESGSFVRGDVVNTSSSDCDQIPEGAASVEPAATPSS